MITKSSSVEAFETFRKRITSQGWSVSTPTWLGARARHDVSCPRGHVRSVFPGNADRQLVCASCKTVALFQAFTDHVEKLGGTVLEEAWMGSAKGHRVRCAEGHESTPQPQYVARGGGICATCGYEGRTPKRAQRSRDAEAAFRARVEALGGTVLEQGWLGNQVPHRVRCAEGHECAPRPNNVAQGSGFCLTCTWASQDVVYVVTDGVTVKLGITSGDPTPRLWAHSRDGLKTVLRCWQGLPSGVAHQTEQAALKRLQDEGAPPVRGCEYFDSSWAPMIVDILASMLHPHL